MNLLERHRDEIQTLCRTHHVKALYVFGSALTEGFNADSDIDLVVEFDGVTLEEYADNYFDLQFALEDLLKRSVDLLEAQALRNPFLRQSIEEQRELLYAA